MQSVIICTVQSRWTKEPVFVLIWANLNILNLNEKSLHHIKEPCMMKCFLIWMLRYIVCNGRFVPF